MHELAVTQGIVEACSERAGDLRIMRVTLEIGTLSCVMVESLQFCFDVATEGTPLEGAELEIIRIPGRSRCRDCGREMELYDVLAGCPCDSFNLEPPQGGDELRIKSMELAPAASTGAWASVRMKEAP